MRRLHFAIFGLLSLIASATNAAEIESVRLADLKQEIRKDFPDVEHLTIEKYLKVANNTLLVDVRSKEEFQMSRIPGAVNIEDRDRLIAFAAEHAQRPIILYCSVGIRSSEAAQFLHQHGFKNVANLEGSIFEWANHGRPLVNDQGFTNSVHPYNSWWGWRYLTPEARRGRHGNPEFDHDTR